MEMVEETFSSTWGRGGGEGSTGGKPKPTSCPSPRPLSTSFQPRPLMQTMGLDCIIYMAQSLQETLSFSLPV